MTATNSSAVLHVAVSDMECAGCAAKVEEAVARLKGVHEIAVSLVAQRVTVHYDPELVIPASVTSAISRAGYSVGDDGESPSFRWGREKLLTLISGLLFFAGLAVGLFEPEEGQVYLWQAMPSASESVLILAAIAGGLNFFGRGFRALLSLSLDMDFLMTVAIGGALAIGEFREAAAIAFLFGSAELLEDYAVDRARDSLRALMQLAPETATVRRSGREVLIPADAVLAGDSILLRPGDRIAVDSIVVDGSSSVDQSPVTGEFAPAFKQVDDELFAGSINQDGFLEARALRTASDSTLSRIIHMVEEAEEHRSPSEQFVRKFARYYTPAITIIALAVVLIPPLFLNASFDEWFVRGLTLLVIACPCALVISTPVAVVSGITSAARNGVLLKGGNYLEALGRIRAVAFDKTGTLTEGRPRVTDIHSLNGQSKEEIVQIAAALEQRSEHPVARAIVERAADLPLPRVERFESMVGQGVRGTIDGTTYLVGRPESFSDFRGALVGFHGTPVEQLRRQGKTAILVATENEAIGLFGLADTVREDAGSAVAALRRRGIECVVMLTGDNEDAARQIGGELGIDQVRANLLPDDKVAAINDLKKTYGAVAMVGDGVNDAPALAAADVGITMGAAGSDAALETADAALMADDLTKLTYLFELSRTSRRVIRQNVWLSILVKFALVAGVFPGMVTLILAVLVGDVGTSLLVTGNSLRLAKIRPD